MDDDLDAPAPQEHPPLLIRCPTCGQRFKVAVELRDRMVECGACENRFRINDEVIMRVRKFYPGERKNPALNRFQRVPHEPGDFALAEARYLDAPDTAMFEPTPPQRIIAGFAGVALMLLVALILMFSARPGGMLDGMATERRMVLAGFVGILGTALLLYANPRSRNKGLSVGLLMTCGLLGLPLVFTTGSQPLPEVAPEGLPVRDFDLSDEPELTNRDDESADIVALREQIITGPLEEEQARLESSGGGKAVGIWLHNLNVSNRILVRDYLVRASGAHDRSHLYPRDGNRYLMVLSEVRQPIEELSLLLAPLGRLDAVHTEISVIEITVDLEKFTEGPAEKLSEPTDPAFYELNKRELESIDLARIGRAVQRLADAPPRLYRSDITRRMIALISEPGVTFHDALCRALIQWSDEPGPAGEAVLPLMRNLISKKQDVPRSMFELLVKEKTTAALPDLHALWQEDSTRWEPLYGDIGPAIEPALLQTLATSKGALRQSSIRLLRKVGTAASLPTLQTLEQDAQGEEKVLLEQARRAILSRQETPSP